MKVVYLSLNKVKKIMKKVTLVCILSIEGSGWLQFAPRQKDYKAERKIKKKTFVYCELRGAI